MSDNKRITDDLTTQQNQSTGNVADGCNPSNQYGVHPKPVTETKVEPPPAQPFPRCG